MTTVSASYRRHRFPPEIISHADWLYYRFTLSYRDVEEMLAQRGITVSYEAIRYWCRKFGSLVARSIRQRQKDRSDQWQQEQSPTVIRDLVNREILILLLMALIMGLMSSMVSQTRSIFGDCK